MDIYNPGRFEWLNTHTLIDTANNEENIKILKKMIRNLKIKKDITVIFGTTQVNPDYAWKLSQMIDGKRKILVDDFCDRALPCSEYRENTRNTEVIHFFSEIKKIQEILSDASQIKIMYGSLYLIGEIMRVSIYKPFASY